MSHMRLLAYLWLTIVALSCWAMPAQAGKRLALVIGNSNYANVTKLPNPANDAADIAAKLKSLGFEVEEGIDLTREQFAILISDFRSRVRYEKADDVVFYYAGHAFNLDGLNQFVPVDAKLKDRQLISYETIRLNDILSQIQVTETQKTVILLDACRNSPLPAELQGDEVGGGLAQLETNDSTANALLIFATLPRQVTKDGKGRNSPFARALLQNMGRPGESIDEIFPDIRKQIIAETGGTQKPFKQGSPPELFYFNPEGIEEETEVAAQEPEPRQPESDEPITAADGPPDVVVLVSAIQADEGDVIIGEEVAEPGAAPPADPVAPALRSEITSNVSSLFAAGTQIATISADQGHSTEENSVDRSAAVSAEAAAGDTISAGQSEALEVRPAEREALTNLGSDVIPGVEVADETAVPIPPPDLAESVEPVVAALPPEQLASLEPQQDEILHSEPEATTTEQASSELLGKIQMALKEAGCFGGNADGQWGNNSQSALERYVKLKAFDIDPVTPSQAVLDQMTVEPGGGPVCVASVARPVKPDKPAAKPARPDKPRKAAAPPKVEKPVKPAKTVKPLRPQPPRPKPPMVRFGP